MSGGGRVVVTIAAMGVVALGLSACAAHTGVRVGGDFSAKPRSVWGAEAGGSINVKVLGWPVQVGASVESTAIYGFGGIAMAGLGLGLGVAPEPGGVGFFATGDAGIPIGWGAEVDGYHLGTTIGLPISLDGDRPDSARNRNLMLIGRHVELVPFVRYRFRALDPLGNAGPYEYHELSLGLSVQARLFSELL